MTSKLDLLTRINLDDLVSSFGWDKNPVPAAILRSLFAGPARKFAMQMVEFDNAVGETNLGEASRRLMRVRYVQDVCVNGSESIPKIGPAIFLSNHPGMSDTISLFAAIDRPDLMVIALNRPFLESLANTTSRLFFVDEAPARRMSVVRQVSAHLRNGGSVLTFPAGEIEPDPEVYSGALEALDTWNASAGTFLRFAPDTKIIPVLVSGVIWKKAAQHRLLRLKQRREDREKLAAALQLIALLLRDARPNKVRVRFAAPVSLEEAGSADAEAIHRLVLQRMRDLINTPPPAQSVSAL